MGMESFSSGPTRESLQSRLSELESQRESYQEKLSTAESTPISHFFSEGEKKTAIEDFQNMLNNIDTEISDCEVNLEGLN